MCERYGFLGVVGSKTSHETDTKHTKSTNCLDVKAVDYPSQ